MTILSSALCPPVAVRHRRWIRILHCSSTVSFGKAHGRQDHCTISCLSGLSRQTSLTVVAERQHRLGVKRVISWAWLGASVREGMSHWPHGSVLTSAVQAVQVALVNSACRGPCVEVQVQIILKSKEELLTGGALCCATTCPAMSHT